MALVWNKAAEAYLGERRMTHGEGACLLHDSAEAPPIRHCIRLESILTTRRGRRDHSDQNQRTKIGDETERIEREEPGRNQIKTMAAEVMDALRTHILGLTRPGAEQAYCLGANLMCGTVEVWRQLESRVQEQHARGQNNGTFGTSKDRLQFRTIGRLCRH